MNVSLRKINAIIVLKFQTIMSNTSVILTPVLALVFAFAMRHLMPEVDVNEAGIFFSLVRLYLALAYF